MKILVHYKGHPDLDGIAEGDNVHTVKPGQGYPPGTLHATVLTAKGSYGVNLGLNQKDRPDMPIWYEVVAEDPKPPEMREFVMVVSIPVDVLDGVEDIDEASSIVNTMLSSSGELLSARPLSEVLAC